MRGLRRRGNYSLTFRSYRCVMNSSITLNYPGLWPLHAYDAVTEVAALSHAVQHTVEMAAGLTGGGRRVDLAGLDHAVGLLCAKALDLPAVDSRSARAALVALLTELDALSLALRTKGS